MSKYDDVPIDDVCEYCGALQIECECCDCGAVHTMDEIDSGICDCCGGIVYD